MYLSKIETRVQKSSRGAGDIYDIHQRIWKGFPGDDQERDFLFRVERKPRRGMEILVQSVREPFWDGVFPEGECAVKSFEPAFAAEDRFFFLTQISAAVAKSNGPGHQPNRVPLPWSQYEDWFAQKGKERGFEVVAADRLGEVFETSFLKKKLRIGGQRMSGVLAVTDSARFHRTFAEGIGRGRGFGFGMISLRRL